MFLDFADIHTHTDTDTQTYTHTYTHAHTHMRPSCSTCDCFLYPYIGVCRGASTNLLLCMTVYLPEILTGKFGRILPLDPQQPLILGFAGRPPFDCRSCFLDLPSRDLCQHKAWVFGTADFDDDALPGSTKAPSLGM